jgi:Endoglucanase
MQVLLSGALVALAGIAQAATTTLTTITKSTVQVATAASGQAVCTGTFSAISASDFVSNLHPGWNLGNTLDAVPDEGSWNNVPVVASTFDTVKAAGFKSIRIPVTWAYHFTGSSPDWTVDPIWLQRVSDVVDMVVARGLYAIVDVHHGMLYELVSKIDLG